MFRPARGWLVLVLFLTQLAPCLAQGSVVGEILTSQPVEALLLISGGVFLLLSVLTVGSGVAEGLCLGSFLLLFVGRYLQGEDPWVPLGLLVLGVICLLAEVFVLPGFGICGVVGLVCIAAMTVLVAGSTKVGLLIFLGTVLFSVGAGFLAVRLLPSTRLTRKMFVVEPPEPSPAVAPAPPQFLPQVGDSGCAATSLRPGGYATFAGERVDVVADNEFIPKGQAVEVTRVEGQKVVVRSISS
jgi:membrane-bound serine protease (ClpP class)